KKLWNAWSKRVPLPFTLLGLGCAVAVLSLFMQLNAVPGAPVFFVLAALLILPGVVGLILHLQKEEPAGGVELAADDAAPELKVYKKHDCNVTAELTAKFAQVEAALLEGMHGQGVQADYESHGPLLKIAEDAATKPDVPEAFRARCRSLLFL